MENQKQMLENGTVEKFPEKPNTIGYRHYQIIFLLGGLLFSYMLRVNISVAIVPMVNKIPGSEAHTFEWNTSITSLVLSSFFWGYVLAQIPAGILSKRFGPKIIFGCSTIVASILTIIIPFAAKSGEWHVVCLLRGLIGLCQGTVYPCVHALLSNWAPRTERAFLSSVVYSGAQIGTVIILSISGWLSKLPIGWPAIFYVSGCACLVWSILFTIFGVNSPSESKKISKSEYEYIRAYTGTCNTKDAKIPWSSIITSMPFIALVFAHCGFSWGFYTLLTQIPTYLNGALNMEIQENALLSALPYLVMWLMSLIMSPIADILINRGITSVQTSRKIFNTISEWIPAAGLVALAYMDEDSKVLAIFLLTLSVGVNSAGYIGYLINHMDLSPNFAGTLMSVSNLFANLMSVFTPIVTGAIVQNEKDPYEWRPVFFLTAGIYFVCNLVFILFAKGTVQPWNEINDLTIIKSPTNFKETNKCDKN